MVSPRTIAILGPTASGKSALAMRIAEVKQVEIVSLDSALIYRGMDIGTAKPTQQERAAVPHHVIDVIDPDETYSVATYLRAAREAIVAIHARGRHALVVGGTMMYFHAMAHGLSSLPSADETIRATLTDEAEVLGWPALHERLRACDPITAARLAPGDAQRIQRALEVFMLTGKPLSAWFEPSEASVGDAAPISMDAVLALEPTDRTWLHARIAQRFDQMLAEGLVDELRSLQARYALHAELPAMRTVGYRQAWQYLAGELDADGLRYRGVVATRQLAKRQMTWLRGLTIAHRFDPADAAHMRAAEQLIDSLL